MIAPDIAQELATEAITNRVAAIFAEFKAMELLDIPALNDKAEEWGIDGLEDEDLQEIAALVDCAIVEVLVGWSR